MSNFSCSSTGHTGFKPLPSLAPVPLQVGQSALVTLISFSTPKAASSKFISISYFMFPLLVLIFFGLKSREAKSSNTKGLNISPISPKPLNPKNPQSSASNPLDQKLHDQTDHILSFLYRLLHMLHLLLNFAFASLSPGLRSADIFASFHKLF